MQVTGMRLGSASHNSKMMMSVYRVLRNVVKSNVDPSRKYNNSTVHSKKSNVCFIFKQNKLTIHIIYSP